MLVGDIQRVREARWFPGSKTKARETCLLAIEIEKRRKG